MLQKSKNHFFIVKSEEKKGQNLWRDVDTLLTIKEVCNSTGNLQKQTVLQGKTQ